MLVHWIWLTTRPHLSDRGRLALMERFEDAEELYFASEEDLKGISGLSDQTLEALMDKSLEDAEQIIHTCMEKDISILTMQDAAYPRRLRSIPDPPQVLYIRGHLPEVDSLPVIAMVGTRKASAYGMGIARKMGYQAAACGAVVVSGLATGIDGFAMKGALESGKPVIGVLGCGADVVYPRSNRELYEDTIRHGCLLTEFPPGTPPNRWNFPRRNRIISGLSCGVLVVEAPEKSGALITAQLAADQGRDVFVIPGNIDVPTSMGSNSLLRMGALAVSSGWDMVSEYEQLFPGKVHRPTAGTLRSMQEQAVRVAEEVTLPEKKPDPKPKKSQKTIDNPTATPYIDHINIPEDLSADEKVIVDLLLSGEQPLDDVIDASGMAPGVVLASLTLLEVKGIVTRLPGKRIRLSNQA